MPRHRNYAVLALLSMVAISGCAHVDERPRPESWPALVVDEAGCTQLSGRYYVEPSQQTDEPTNSETLLATILLPAAEALAQSRSLAINADDPQWLSVNAYSESGDLLVERRYPVGGDFIECVQGRLVLDMQFKPEVKRAADNPLLGVSYEHNDLHKAVDGSLVVQSRGGAIGVVYAVAPIYVAVKQWYRFAPFDEQP